MSGVQSHIITVNCFKLCFKDCEIPVAGGSQEIVVKHLERNKLSGIFLVPFFCQLELSNLIGLDFQNPSPGFSFRPKPSMFRL